MRILIGNQIDPAIRDRGDLRAWTQRVLWFARNGDLIVLCDKPDPDFLSYATAHTGTDPASLRILVAPAGDHVHRLLAPESLTAESFLREVRDALGPTGTPGVEHIFALWPSASVARFATALGIADKLPGAAFTGQRGGELANNKAIFRALAAAADVAIPDGTVVHSPQEAARATSALLGQTGAVMVKQAHNGAGVGNQLVVADSSLLLDHVGARHLHELSSDAGAISEYWARRWDWASAGGRFPVVIETFTPHTTSVYTEHYAADTGTRPTEMGTLLYVGRRLSHQIVPLRGHDAVRTQLLAGGTRLAEAWRAIGFRGFLSADAIVTPDGRVVFTEVNAQVSGSLHIYDVIAHRIVDTSANPERSVVEYHVPPTWTVPDGAAFLAAVRELGCDYDAATRTGVIVSMPVIPLEPGRAQFLFCIAYSDDAERLAIFGALDNRFATIPADAHDPSEHIGIPRRSSSLLQG